MGNTVVIVSGVSPDDRAGESEVFSEVNSCDGRCDVNLWDNWTNNFWKQRTPYNAMQTDLFYYLYTIYIQVGTLLTWKAL